MTEHLEIARLIDSRRGEVVNYAVSAVMQDPTWEERNGSGIAERLALDFGMNLATLAKSVRYRSPMIFEDHMRWRRNQIQGFGCATGHVREICGHLWHGLSMHLPEDWQPAVYGYMQSAMKGLNYSSPAAQALAAHQDALAAQLVAATFDAHWHWQAAYGNDGRERMLYDCWFLVDYLVDALGGGKNEFLSRYTNLMRGDLNRRGLSSAHAQQLIWLLNEACRVHLPPASAEDVQHSLVLAAAVLEHNHESVQDLLAAQDGLINEVANQLTTAGLAPQSEQTALEVAWYLAYLADSLAVGDPTPLLGYTRWMQHWLASQGLPDTPLRHSYQALGGALGRHLPSYVATEATTLLQAAQRTL